MTLTTRDPGHCTKEKTQTENYSLKHVIVCKNRRAGTHLNNKLDMCAHSAKRCWSSRGIDNPGVLRPKRGFGWGHVDCCTLLETKVGKDGQTRQTMSEVADSTEIKTHTKTPLCRARPAHGSWPCRASPMAESMPELQIEPLNTHGRTTPRVKRRAMDDVSQARSKRGKTTHCNQRRVTVREQRRPTPNCPVFPAAWCWRSDGHQWAHVPGVCCERAITAAESGTRVPEESEWSWPNKARTRPVDTRTLSGNARSQRPKRRAFPMPIQGDDFPIVAVQSPTARDFERSHQ